MELLGLLALGRRPGPGPATYTPTIPPQPRQSTGPSRNLWAGTARSWPTALLQQLGAARLIRCRWCFAAWAWRVLRSRAWPRWWLRILLAAPRHADRRGLRSAACPARLLAAGERPRRRLGPDAAGQTGDLPLGRALMAAIGSAGLAGLLLMYALGLSSGEWQGLLLLGPLRPRRCCGRGAASRRGRAGRCAAERQASRAPLAGPPPRARRRSSKPQKANGARQEPKLVAKSDEAARPSDEDDDVLLENELPPLPKALTEGAGPGGRAAPPAPSRANARPKANQRRFEFADAGDYELPPLSPAGQSAEDTGRAAVNRGRAGEERPPAGDRAAGLRRARRDRQGPARPGGDPLRAGAGARHQDQPRGRPGRRHRPLDERGLGARRRGAGLQLDIGIELPNASARRSTCARTARLPGLRARPAASCR